MYLNLRITWQKYISLANSCHDATLLGRASPSMIHYISGKTQNCWFLSITLAPFKAPPKPLQKYPVALGRKNRPKRFSQKGYEIETFYLFTFNSLVMGYTLHSSWVNHSHPSVCPSSLPKVRKRDLLIKKKKKHTLSNSRLFTLNLQHNPVVKQINQNISKE